MTACDPDWLTEKAAEELWQPAQWTRWKVLRRRFENLRAEPRYTDTDAGSVLVAGRDDRDQLPPLTSALRADDEFPLLAALTRLMSETAQSRWRQVEGSLAGADSRAEPDVVQEWLRRRVV
jgi:hypothetical protein